MYTGFSWFSGINSRKCWFRSGTCYITVMYWYCPHMHVVMKANWPKFSPYSVSLFELQVISRLSLSMRVYTVHVHNCYIKMWNHYNSPLPRCRGHQSLGNVCWPLEGERCPRCHEIYSLQLDFFCGVLFYMKFCSFFFFLSFSTAEIVLFIILVSYFKMSPEKKIELQKRNWPICNDGIKAQKICTTRKRFSTNEIKF